MKFLQFLIILFLFEYGITSETCNKESLKNLRKVLASKRNEDVNNAGQECEDIVKGIISYGSRFRNDYKSKAVKIVQIPKTDFDFKTSSQHENSYNELTEKYNNAIKELTEVRQKFSTLNKYSIFPYSNGSYCIISEENGRTAINIVKEIYQITTHTNYDGKKCLLIQFLSDDFDKFLDEHKKFNTFENEIKKSFIDNRNKIMMSTNDQNLDKINEIIESLGVEVNNLNEQIVEKIEDFAIHSFQNGRGSLELREILENTEESELIKYLETAYDCTLNNLYNILAILPRTSYKIIKNLIDECERDTSSLPYLKILKSFKDSTLAEKTEEVYKIIGDEIRENNTESIMKFLQYYDIIELDTNLLIKSVYNCDISNFETIARLVELINSREICMEKIYYDEFIGCGHTDTIEHFMFGFWILKRQSNDGTGKYNQDFEATLKAIPKAINLVAHDKEIVLATKDYNHTLRSQTASESRFKIVPLENGRKFYIEEHEDRRDRLFMNHRLRVINGKGNNEKYEWQFIPIDNATKFYIYNPFYKAYLSSEETKTEFNENFNQGYPEVDENNKQKFEWYISVILRRYEILKDRSEVKH